MLRPCLEPGCPELVQRGPRCPAHTKQRDKQINRAGRKVYSTKKWKLTRRKKLALNPICEWDGCNQLAEDVHHKHGVEAGPYSLDGLEALCHSHHSQLTRRSQLV